MSLVEEAPPELSTTASVEIYTRLHRKLSTAGALFDPSWQCAADSKADIARWMSALLRQRSRESISLPMFSDVTERLALLTPPELQKLFCAAMMLSRRENLRHCIDGVKLRAMQSMIGPTTMVSIMKSQVSRRPPRFATDWNVSSLIAEALAQIDYAAADSHRSVLDCIRIALPKQLPQVQVDYDEVAFKSLLREAHAWYPELTWLFG